jgi:site-specific DNA-methyltransferase (adenine-specific)
MLNLMKGDAMALLPGIKPGSVDLVCVDLPYGVLRGLEWDDPLPLPAMWKQVHRILKPRGACVMTATQPFTSHLINSNVANFRYCWHWDKKAPTGFQLAHKQPLRHIEDVCVFYQTPGGTYNPQGVARINAHKVNRSVKRRQLEGNINAKAGSEYVQEFTNWPRQLLTIPRDDTEHPTQKPVALMRYLIMTYSNEGDTVLDFCMGSGTTGVAAYGAGRKFIGVEKDPKFFTMASNRINGSRSPFDNKRGTTK